MKTKILVKLLFLLLGFLLYAGGAYAADEGMIWGATLYAKGEEIGGMSVYQVTIGIGENELAIPAPPAAPMYSVKMDLVSSTDGELLSKEIHPENAQRMSTWTLSIDPHGNILPDTIRTAIISWNSGDFLKSICMIRQGRNDLGGHIIVNNMNTTSSLSVEGGPKKQFFTIECSY